MPGVVIARAETQDAGELLAVQRAAFQREALLYNDHTIEPLRESMADVEEAISRYIVLKATAGSRIVGSVRGVLEDHICHVARLAVAPDLQGQGIGFSLMRELEKATPEAARYELFTGAESLGNQRLYRRLGYREFKRRAETPTLTFVYMEKMRLTTSHK